MLIWTFFSFSQITPITNLPLSFFLQHIITILRVVCIIIYTFCINLHLCLTNVAKSAIMYVYLVQGGRYG